MIKVLQVLPQLNASGIATLLINYFSRIDDVHNDFIVYDQSYAGINEKFFIDKGSKIYKITLPKKNMIKSYQEHEKIIKEGQYDIIHCHMQYSNLIPILLAKRYGIKIRISHSHIAFVKENLIQKLKRFLVEPIIEKFSTDLWACSTSSGTWTYNKNNFAEKNGYILNNAINLNEFCFSKQDRDKIREQLDLNGKTVIGCFARLKYPKNHEFLFEIFYEYLKINPDSVLLLAGSEKIPDDLNNKIVELNIQDHIVFLGIRKDIDKLMNAVDCFVMPSIYEGLGIAYIEAQANGVPCLATDRVPLEVNVVDLVEFISLNKSAEFWASRIKTTDDAERTKYFEKMLNSEFNIETEAIKLKNKYEQMLHSLK